MTMRFIAGVPPQSCIKGIPKKPEFKKISEGMKERLSSLKTVAYRSEVRASSSATTVVAPIRSRTTEAWMSLL